MKTFIMRMWLTCNQSAENALAGFDLRFPRVLERKWAEFAIEVDPSVPDDLGNKIDAKIYEQCQVHLLVDVDPQATEVRVFGSGGTGQWVPAGGGQHEGRESVQALVGGFARRWNYTVDSGTSKEIESEVFVHTRHYELT